MEDEGMVDHAAHLGENVIGPALASFAQKRVSVGEVRDKGGFWVIELITHQQSREPLGPYGGTSAEMGKLVAACKERGLIPFTNFNRIHVVPPFNTSKEEASEGLQILDGVLDSADGLLS